MYLNKSKLLKSTLIPALLLALLSSAISFAADLGTTLKADSLRAEPFADAKTTGSFNRGDKVEILTKKGAWIKVKTTKSTGWVRLLSVKRGTSSSGGSSNVAGVLDVASGRAGTGQVVATTGVRGLSAEELKSAKFDEAQVKQLESYTLNATQGQEFANSGGLKPVQFKYFPAAAKQGSAK
jgi:uncharacterized protein YgiM (DUF1202 family)